MQSRNANVSSRLQLHELPLFGKSKELAILNEAYDRTKKHHSTESNESMHTKKTSGTVPSPEIVIISGKSGTGKSTLVETMIKEQMKKSPQDFLVGRYKTLFCTGKFHQFKKTPQPFSALRQAFLELCDSILNTDECDRVDICNDLKRVLGPQGDILVDIVPGITSLLEFAADYSQGEKEELMGETQGFIEDFFRLEYLLKLFVRTVCKYRLIVLFFDDLQWADQSTVKLIHAIISNNDTTPFLFIGTYREDEMELSEKHPLNQMLSEIKKCRPIEQIHMDQIGIDSIADLIYYLTDCSRDLARKAAEILHRKTYGNGFTILEILQLWERKKLIEYSWMSSEWMLKIDEIAGYADLDDSVADIVAKRIELLPEEVQLLLKVSACLWSRFHVTSLYLVMKGLKAFDTVDKLEKEQDFIIALDRAAEENFLDKLKGGFYKFTHDRIQASAYSLFPEGPERDRLHLELGKALETTLNEGNEWILFLVADQMNNGSSQLKDDAERLIVARLNLEAAQKAIKVSSFVPALDYLMHGILLLEPNSWKFQYQLSLRLYSLGAEMAMCLGDLPTCIDYADEVIRNGKCLMDKISVYKSLVNAYGDKSFYEKAMQINLEVLSDLEEALPKRAHLGHLLIRLLTTLRMLNRTSYKDIKNLPLMTNENKAAAMLFLNQYAVHALMLQRPKDMLLSMICSVQVTLRYGLHKLSSVAICNFGIVLGSIGKKKDGIQYGRLAMELVDKLNAKEWEANVAQVSFAFLRHWEDSYTSALVGLTEAYKCGMAYGDIEFAFYNAACAVTFHYLSGLNLQSCELDCRRYCEQMRIYKRDNNYNVTCPLWQFLLNLLGHSADPLKLTGEAMDEDIFVERMDQEHNIGALQTFWIYKGQISYLFGDLEEARKVLVAYGKTKRNLEMHIFTAIYAFLYCLVSLGLARKSRNRLHKREAKKMIKIIEQWVKTGNINFAHKLLLVKAEFSCLSHRIKEEQVRQLYDRAIATASRAGFIHDAALANERAGSWFAERSDHFWTQTYIQRAYMLYSDWSAHGKARDLMRQYPTIFSGDAAFREACSVTNEMDSQKSLSSYAHLLQSDLDPVFLSSDSFAPGTNNDGRRTTLFRGIQRFDSTASERHAKIGSNNLGIILPQM